MLLLESTARDIILVPGVDTTGIEMYTESMQIAELFRDPRKIQRATPFNRVIANTYGKGKPEFSQELPAPPPIEDGPPPDGSPDFREIPPRLPSGSYGGFY